MKIFWNERGITPLPLSYRVRIKQALQMVAKNHNQYKNTMLELTFVSSDEMCKFNFHHRQKNEPTDVLSFPMIPMNSHISKANMSLSEESVVRVSPTKRRDLGQHPILGDIIICVDVAEEQAKEYNHSLERELAFLAVHGILHILGYDHDNPESEEKMLQAQKEVLEKVGLPR